MVDLIVQNVLGKPRLIEYQIIQGEAPILSILLSRLERFATMLRVGVLRYISETVKCYQHLTASKDNQMSTPSNCPFGKFNLSCPTLPTNPHKELHRLDKALYRAEKRGLPATLTPEQWGRILYQHNFNCHFCNAPFETIEHVVSLGAGGGTTAQNCVPCCDPCNQKRSRCEQIVRNLIPYLTDEHVQDLLIPIRGSNDGKQ